MKNGFKKQIARLGLLCSALMLDACTFGDPLYADNRFNGALISLLLIVFLCVGVGLFFRRRKVNRRSNL